MAVAAATGASVLAIAPAAFAAAPNISGVSPAATVGLGAGQSGHPARTIVISVTNVATTDNVTVTFPGFTGLTAAVTNVDGTAHTVTANVSTSATSAASSGFNLTLTDVTTSSSDTTPFAITAPPTLTSVSQPRLLVGTTTAETLTGTGLVAGVVATAPNASGVSFGAVSNVNAQGTSGTVSATVANNAPGGPVAVTLANTDGGWSTTNGAITVDTFVVSDISPSTATNADANTAVPVTVTGQGIPSGSTTLKLTPNFTVTGQDPITASGTTAGNGQSWSGTVNLAAVAPGAYTVQLVNGSNTGTLTSKSFTVTAVGAPTITTVTPSSVGAGTDATLTITGTNFARGATVTFSKTGFTVTGAITYTSSTSMQVPIHVASNAATGTANATSVTVTNIGPTPNSGTKTAAITVPAPPTITSTSPTQLGQGATTTLTINGTGFQAGATVTFATGITATGSPTITSTQIKIGVKVAANSPNKVDVTVKNPDNGTVKTTLTINAFTVTSVAPHYVATTFSGTLTVSGTGFANGATVTFPAGSGVAVQSGKSSTVAANGQSLTVPIVVSRSSAGTVDVTVTNTTDLGTATCTGCLMVAVAPGAPTNVLATKSGTTASVHWDAVVSPRDGGAPITGYTVTVTSPSGTGIPPQTLNASTTTATFNNLDASTDYVFAVTATNAANLTSQVSSASTSRKSQLTLHAQQHRTVSGQADPLSGRLLDARGNPIVGATVVVHRRSDTGVAGIVGTLTTDATGGWATTPRPLTNTTYFATYAGDGTNDGSTSASVRVVVGARVSIHGVISATSKVITITGHVAPDKAGETVRLVGFDRNGNLHHFGARTLDGNSHYRFRMKLPAGRWRFQVRIGQTVGNGSGKSANLIAQG
jgi:hypothetical protein